MATWDRRLTAASGRLEHPMEKRRGTQVPEVPSGLHPDDNAAVEALLRLALTKATFSTTLLARRIEPTEHAFAEVTVEADATGAHLLCTTVDADNVGVRDPLTGLPTRVLVRERLMHALAASHRPQTSVAVFFVDIDGFSLINDAAGHAGADKVLKEVADRLATQLRPEDTLGRLQKDEFLVIVNGIVHPDDAHALAERLREAVADTGGAAGCVDVSVSVGIALGDSTTDPDELLAQAEHAVGRAKELGRDRSELFDDALRTQTERRVTIDQELRRGLSDGTLEVHFQPIVDLGTLRVVGAEALMRVIAHDGTPLAPRELLAAANVNGLLRRVESVVLQTACARAAEWHSGETQITVSVNITDRQFRDPNLVETITRVLAENNLDAGRLMLEISESTFASNPERARATVDHLRATGVLIAVDEFCGTEAMIDQLELIGVDLVKVDRGLVHACATPWGITLLKSTFASLHRLQIPATAVGVETEEQMSALRELGCRFAQGYLFTKAVPATKFPEMLGALERS